MKTMSDREALARRIVGGARIQSASFARIAEAMGEELPALTISECRAIADSTNRTITQIYTAFPHRPND